MVLKTQINAVINILAACKEWKKSTYIGLKDKIISITDKSFATVMYYTEQKKN